MDGCTRNLARESSSRSGNVVTMEMRRMLTNKFYFLMVTGSESQEINERIPKMRENKSKKRTEQEVYVEIRTTGRVKIYEDKRIK